MILYPVEELEEKLSKVDIQELLKISSIPVTENLLDNEFYGNALRIYLLLSYSGLFSQEKQSQVFYNRYYWFLTFLEKYKSIKGNDMGLEQQAFQILEDADNINDEINWDIVEQLNHQVTNSAIAELV